MSVRFTCAACKQTFQSEWTEEEALSEKETNWGNISVDECDPLCDDCHEKFMEWYNSSVGHA